MRQELGTIERMGATALDPVTQRDAAEYIELMCGELATLSSRTGLRFLYYLLEVAREEAAAQTQNGGENPFPRSRSS